MGARWFGAAVKRKEDPALLAGKGRFIDDTATHRRPVLGPRLYAAIDDLFSYAGRQQGSLNHGVLPP